MTPPPTAAPRRPGLDSLGFLWTLLRTDFKVRYHGSIGGFGWALLRPAAIFLVLLAVFSLVFSWSPDYKLKLIVGLFLWDFFAEATKVGLSSLHAKGALLARARVPTWVLVVSSASNPLLTLAVFASVVLITLAIVGRLPGAVQLLLFAAYLSCLLAVVIGFSLAASVLFLRYRDLNQVWEVVLQAGFFVAPIIYPLDILPEKFHFFPYLWPPTPVIQFSRAVLIEGVLPTWRAHALLVLQSGLILWLGLLVHRHHSRRVAEYL
jgi:ABC-type polysaccharide/polyol phosphate export permease